MGPQVMPVLRKSQPSSNGTTDSAFASSGLGSTSFQLNSVLKKDKKN